MHVFRPIQEDIVFNALSLHEIFVDEAKAYLFAINQGLIQDSQICTCGSHMILINNQDVKFGQQWKCNGCSKRRSVLHGSIFTRGHIEINKVIHLIYLWSVQTNVNAAAFEAIVSENTVTNYFQAFRQCAKEWWDEKKQTPIGGPGMVVEVDESVITKRKYNRGRIIPEVWVFGGVCRNTGQRFAKVVKNRTATTLEHYIFKHIQTGSEITSDGWRGYNCIDNMPFPHPYAAHNVVNHSLNFVDPMNPAIHTQTVERMWRELKDIKRRYQGVSESEWKFHIAEYMWRFSNVICRNNAFIEAIKLIKNTDFS